MRFELWGVSSTSSLALPDHPAGFVILSLYVLFLLVILYRQRSELLRFRAKSIVLSIALMLLSALTNRLFPVTTFSAEQHPALGSISNPFVTILPFGFGPALFAGISLGSGAGMLVGLVGGISRSLWGSQQLLDVFPFAVGAFFAGLATQQRYSGALYQVLRRPIGGSLVGLATVLIGVTINSYVVNYATADYLVALDLSISNGGAFLLPLLIEAILSGLIVSLILFGLSDKSRQAMLVPSPLNRSLNQRLVVTFLVFAILLSLVMFGYGFNRAIEVAEESVAIQMARDAQKISLDVPTFRNRVQNLLIQSADIEELLDTDQDRVQAALGTIFRSGDYFQTIILATKDEQVASSYPSTTPNVDLSPSELNAIDEVIASGRPKIDPAVALSNGGFYIPAYVPLPESDEGKINAVIIGRIPEISLDQLKRGLQGTFGNGVGFLVDEQDNIIAHPDPDFIMKNWTSPEIIERPIEAELVSPGTAYESRQGSTNAREVVYFQSGPDHPWTTVVTMPYGVILKQALDISRQLVLIPIFTLLATSVYLLLLGRSVAQPLQDLAQATHEMAGGQLNVSIKAQGEDEIGRLGRAFGQMQQSIKRHLDEQALLLEVSKIVASSIDLKQGMPAILKGALRGTGAAGARIVVRNPTGRQPLTFGEGPAKEIMAPFDRQINSLLFAHKELTLPNPEEVNKVLKSSGQEAPLPNALVALPLADHNQYRGVLWLSYRKKHIFNHTELNFLRTLASQTSVLVENARLYAMAEGGRRRLAAVLASTADAVIVTDQTNRVLLVNPAMEYHFGIEAGEIIGRPLRDAVKSPLLIQAMTTGQAKESNLEIVGNTGKVFNASASTIKNQNGQAIGRVSVLHDITYLKEIDDMKSEFVANVSHDLRSPLTFMLSYASMLSMLGKLEPAQQEYVDKIVGGIEQMSALVDNLLDMARLEAGIELVTSKFRIEELLASIVEEYGQPAKAAGINLESNITGDIAPIVADTSLIRQAVANLVNNVIKHAPGSGRAELHAVQVEDRLIISVRDRGPGLSREDQASVYDKFYRVPSEGNRRSKGSGLGLALVKRIAERHGGESWCESILGQGSAFFIALPIEDAVK